MIYFFIFIAILLFFVISNFRKRDANLKLTFKQNWGKRIEKYRDPDRIAKYADFKHLSDHNSLPSQTLKDIDMESLFSFLDRTISSIGQQCLYKKLVSISTPDNLKIFDRQSDYFTHNIKKREEVQKILFRLEANGSFRIADFFVSKEIKKTIYDQLYKWLSILMVVGLLAAIFFPTILIYLIPVIAVNLSISFIFKYRNEKKLNAVKEVYGLIKACRRLHKTETIIDGKLIPATIASFKSFERRFQYLNFGIPEDDFLKTLFYMIDMIKSFFLLDLHLLNSSYNKVVNALGSLEELYQYVGVFDTAISTSSLKSDKSIKWCKPMLTNEKKILQFTNATHPLIENCVPNSINLKGKSAFITGSNMSGKSTFLRTALINVLLAQTLYVCFAESFTLTNMQPFSCINIDDDLSKGSSYFFMEVAVIKNMTEQIPREKSNFFVIDEVFKGTNTIERISLAKAILNYLNNTDNIVIASSHDLELIDLLPSQFDMFYFSETIQDDVLLFDHSIKPGFLKTTNAIKMVELEGFPKSIVDEAYEIAGQFKNDKSEQNLLQ